MSDLTAVSLFAGIEGFGLALERAGVNVVAAVEIDPDCRGVIARHFAQTALFEDVTEVTGEQLRAAGFTPRRGILCGGWPCQDLSVAGRRAGLGGSRSGLFWQVVRLADEVLPQWLVLENVPGLLSAVCPCPGDETCIDNGRALACGRWETRGGKRTWLDHVTHAPQGGGCYGGCMEQHGGAMGSVVGALEQLGYGLCWRVLDSRYFGVAQRRERVFFVGCLGDGAAPVEVLLEPESGSGHPAAGRPARENAAGPTGCRAGVAGVASALTASYGNGTGSDLGVTGTVIANAITPGHHGRGTSANPAEENHLVVTTLQGGGRRGHRIDAEGAAGGHLIPVSRSAPFPSRDVIACDTSREGKGADSDATSGFVVQPVALRGRDEGGQIEAGDPGEPAFALRTPGGGSSYPMIAHALTSEGADASEDGTGRGTPLVVAAGHATGDGVSDPGRRSEDDVNLVPMAFNPQTGGSKARLGYGETPTALQASQITGVQQAAAVRRLTPRECERLQNFPDDWTRWKLAGAELVEQSDSARYRQVGNAVTVSVVAWIARRLVAADERRCWP